MAYRIAYAYTSHVGKIRENNEDNFWCCGDYLNVDNQGMTEVRFGSADQEEFPLLAVFDGMGGESCGKSRPIWLPMPVKGVTGKREPVPLEKWRAFLWKA